MRRWRIFHACILQKTLNSLRSTQPRLDREQACKTKRGTVTARTISFTAYNTAQTIVLSSNNHIKRSDIVPILIYLNSKTYIVSKSNNFDVRSF